MRLTYLQLFKEKKYDEKYLISLSLLTALFVNGFSVSIFSNNKQASECFGCCCNFVLHHHYLYPSLILHIA